MAGKLLSSDLSHIGLDDAIVQSGVGKPGLPASSFSGAKKVSASGLLGLFGCKIHTQPVLNQQPELFKQLKTELRQKYLADIDAEEHDGEADRLNARITKDESTTWLEKQLAKVTGNEKVFRGSDRDQINRDAAKLAVIKRIETEIDRLPNATVLTPRLLRELTQKVELQFGFIEMDAIHGYQPESSGGWVSNVQTFDPLKDYKSLLKNTPDNPGSIIRLVADKNSGESKLVSSSRPFPQEKGTIDKTLFHCVAALKQAYFRADPGAAFISSKEIAFDRAVSRYVEKNLRNATKGEMREMNHGDFLNLEKLAFSFRSTIGRVERPLNEMVISENPEIAHSRYAGFTLDKNHSAIHLVNDGGPHATMYIENYDPSSSKWSLIKIHFGYSVSKRSEKRTYQNYISDTVLPGKIMLSETSAELRNPGAISNIEVLSEADLKIGRQVPSKLLGILDVGRKATDTTSLRIPRSEVEKMLDTVRTQRGGSDDDLQGNAALYHLKGRDLSKNDLVAHLRTYTHQQISDTRDLARMEQVLKLVIDTPPPIIREDPAPPSLSQNKELNPETDLLSEEPLDTAGKPEETLIVRLRRSGLMKSAQELPEDARQVVKERGRDIMAARASADPSDWNCAEKRMKDLLHAAQKGLQEILKDPSLTPEERHFLNGFVERKAGKPTAIQDQCGLIWQNHRTLHQISQKIGALQTLPELEKSIEEKRATLTRFRETEKELRARYFEASEKLAKAMAPLKPENWTVSPSAQDLRNYSETSAEQYLYKYDEFENSAIIQVGKNKFETHIKSLLKEEMAPEDFKKLENAQILHNPKSWQKILTADELNTAYTTDRAGFDRWFSDFLSKGGGQYAEGAGRKEAETHIRKELGSLSADLKAAHSAYAQNRDHAADIHALETALGLEEARLRDLSSDMTGGTAGERKFRAGNCAEWLRNILRLAGVNLSGIKNISGPLGTADPQELARGQYKTFRFGQSDVAASRRTAPANASDFLTNSRMSGRIYDMQGMIRV